MPNRRPITVALLLTLFASCGGVLYADAKRPNVILIMSDDQGWGQVGYMDHPHLKGKTPNLDAMAKDGVKQLRGVTAKFTDGGGGKEVPREGRNRPGMGWSAEGLKAFDKLCRDIVHDRTRCEARIRFETDYRLRKRAEEEQKKKKKKDRKSYSDDDKMPDDVFNEMDRDLLFGTESDAQFLEDRQMAEGEILPGDYNDVVDQVVHGALNQLQGTADVSPLAATPTGDHCAALGGNHDEDEPSPTAV